MQHWPVCQWQLLHLHKFRTQQLTYSLSWAFTDMSRQPATVALASATSTVAQPVQTYVASCTLSSTRRAQRIQQTLWKSTALVGCIHSTSLTNFTLPRWCNKFRKPHFQLHDSWQATHSLKICTRLLTCCSLENSWKHAFYFLVKLLMINEFWLFSFYGLLQRTNVHTIPGALEICR